jgi:hypothetical protein
MTPRKPHPRDALMLDELQKNPYVTTLDARERLGITAPAGCVLRLRRAGYEIQTFFLRELDVTGTPHTVAQYVLGDSHEA